MLVIRFPIVFVSSGTTTNITRETIPTTNRIVRSRLIVLANFSASLFPFSLAFPKSFFSKKLIGTLITNAIAPPTAKGNRIVHIVLNTRSTSSNFHNTTTRRAVKTINSRIFFIVCLLKSILCTTYFFHFYGNILT